LIRKRAVRKDFPKTKNLQIVDLQDLGSLISLYGGELGIRTPGTFHSSTVFKTAAIDHSASSPGAKVQNRAELANLILIFFQLFNKSV
jgi:hypothetical protein